MKIDMYQVDAFATKTFEGNPAAVCPLDKWLPDEQLQKIAEENNLSETAFFVKDEDNYQLRWFTPEDEVDLCGHATLAAAHVLFKQLGYAKSIIKFSTKSGQLVVKKTNDGYCMDFPATVPFKMENIQLLTEALGVKPVELLSGFDYIVVLESIAAVINVSPDFEKLSQLDLRGVVITAPGEDEDFVSRCFYPKLRVNEDPVTGSAHCQLAPYWAKRLGKNKFTAKQLSKRTGKLACEVRGERVLLAGRAADYLKGVITF